MTPKKVMTGVLSATLRTLAVGSLAVMSGSIATVAAIKKPATPTCSVDAATGVSIPRVVRGACVAASADRTVLVQRSEDGLLIVTLETRPLAATLAAGERGSLRVSGASSRVVFCPTNLLDFASGAPTPACIGNARSWEPGPGALVGSGTVRADLRFDGTGAARCPSTARTTAVVRSSAGVRFDLASSIAMIDEPGRRDSCATIYDRIELDLGGTAADPSADVEVARTAVGTGRLEQLMQLDDEQWRVVDLLLSLTPRDWQTFEAVVRNGGGSVGTPGTVAPSAPLETLGLPDVVNTILARVNAIRSNLDALSGRIPDRADVRNLLGQVDLSRLRDMLGEVRDTVQGLIDIARDLRDGYDSFDVVQFRTRLGDVLTDVESASSLYQRLLCVDDPDFPVRHLSTVPLRRLLDRAPGVTLYALSKILEAIDSGWDQRIGAVIAAVPSEVTGFCNDGARPRAVRRFDATNVVCKALRPKAVGTSLALVKVKIAGGLMGFRYAKNHTKEEIQVTAGAVAAAGATAGTTVKNPAHEAAEQWVDRLENMKDAIESLTDRRKDCLDADKDIEEALMDCVKDGCTCTAPLSMLLQGAAPPTYTYVADLVDVRIDQAEEAGLPYVADARDMHDDAVDEVHDETAAGYTLLCQSYAYLLAPAESAPGAPSPVRPPGVRPGVGRDR